MKNATKKFALAILATTATAAFGGDFKASDQEPIDGAKIFVYTGQVDQGDADKLIALANQNPKLAIVISSPGGNFFEGMKLGEVARKSQGKINLYIHQAFSAAGLFALGDPNARFANDESMIGLHFAFPKDGKTEDGVDQYIGFAMGNYLRNMMSEEAAIGMMGMMLEARMKGGTQGMVVLTPKSKGWEIMLPKPVTKTLQPQIGSL